MASAESILDRVTGRSIDQVLQEGVAGVLLAISASIISGILSVAELITSPIDSLAKVFGTVINAFFIEPLRIIGQAAQTSAISLSPGGDFAAGPLTLILGLVTVLAFFWILARFLSEDETSNIAPGLPFDLGFWPFRDEEASQDD